MITIIVSLRLMDCHAKMVHCSLSKVDGIDFLLQNKGITMFKIFIWGGIS